MSVLDFLFFPYCRFVPFSKFGFCNLHVFIAVELLCTFHVICFIFFIMMTSALYRVQCGLSQPLNGSSSTSPPHVFVFFAPGVAPRSARVCASRRQVFCLFCIALNWFYLHSVPSFLKWAEPLIIRCSNTKAGCQAFCAGLMAMLTLMFHATALPSPRPTHQKMPLRSLWKISNDDHPRDLFLLGGYEPGNFFTAGGGSHWALLIHHGAYQGRPLRQRPAKAGWRHVGIPRSFRFRCWR